MERTVREYAARGGCRRTAGRSGRQENRELRPAERRRLLQLAASSGIFILLVAVKLLLPGKLDGVGEKLDAALRQNMDLQAVFSAIGEAASGERDVGGALDQVYQAVFRPETFSAYETSARLAEEEPAALTALHAAAEEQGSPEEQEAEEPAEVATLAYVLYSSQNLPENVCMEQTLLGFRYCTPVSAPISSGFGYRDHPTEGEERFHYGVDLAAEEGCEVCCFADGTVKAVGESSSYGKYVIVSHENGYETLYAHCSAISVSSGTAVKAGDTLGRVGQTGMATGPHLHFELHRDGVYLNPVYYAAAA